jgi:hypothetical protein
MNPNATGPTQSVEEVAEMLGFSAEEAAYIRQWHEAEMEKARDEGRKEAVGEVLKSLGAKRGRRHRAYRFTLEEILKGIEEDRELAGGARRPRTGER